MTSNSSVPNAVAISIDDLHRLQAIAEAAARIADELNHTSGATNIRNVNAKVDAALGQSRSEWDDYGNVNEWSSQIKHGSTHAVIHPEDCDQSPA